MDLDKISDMITRESRPKLLRFEAEQDSRGCKLCTLNYGPEPMSPAHWFFDVLPYWLWGNYPGDSTSFWRRVWGRGK
jgi:hypothetical protein